MLKPEKLQDNDKVAIVAPAQAARKETVQRAVEMVRALGLTPVAYPSCYLVDDTEAVSDAARAGDINEAFRDSSVRGLFALKAGSGTLGLLDLIDYETIKVNPKVFIGFSDITGLHLALNKLCGLVTLHGPLATSRIYQKANGRMAFDPYTYAYLRENLFADRPLGVLRNPPDEPMDCLSPGIARGRIIGGNLTLLARTVGTKYEVEATGRLLFLEDMGESLADIAAMLGVLARARKFGDCRGIILGPWVKCGEEYADAQERAARLRELFLEALGPFGKPILANLRGGHSVPMLTLPLGVQAELDAKRRQINVLESANR